VTTSASYTLAFEFLNTERLMTGWVLLIVGTVGFAALWCLASKPWQAVKSWQSLRKLAPSTILSLLIVILAWYFINRSLLAEMFGGETVDGMVSGFVRTDNDRGFLITAEFSVGDVPFQVTYRHGRAAEVLGLPGWSGGPLRDGLHLRVRHHNGKILRIEVREP
jgi:hypothetical protein